MTPLAATTITLQLVLPPGVADLLARLALALERLAPPMPVALLERLPPLPPPAPTPPATPLPKAIAAPPALLSPPGLPPARPSPAPPLPDAELRWSEARLAMLRRDWPVQKIAAVTRGLNALPGQPLTEAVVLAKGYNVGLKRATSATLNPSRAVSAPPQSPAGPPAPPSPVALSDTTVAVPFANVAIWAGPRGISFERWSDLPGVNKKRRELGQPQFIQEGFGR